MFRAITHIKHPPPTAVFSLGFQQPHRYRCCPTSTRQLFRMLLPVCGDEIHLVPNDTSKRFPLRRLNALMKAHDRRRRAHSFYSAAYCAPRAQDRRLKTKHTHVWSHTLMSMIRNRCSFCPYTGICRSALHCYM